MLKIHEMVKDLFSDLDLDLPEDYVHGHIAGPAVVIDAVALY